MLISLTAWSKGFEIKVTVNGVQDSTCTLAYYYGDKQYIKETAAADKKGNLVFKGDEDLPAGIYLVVLPGKKYFEFVVDQEQKFSMQTDTTNLINNMVVKGSKENTVFFSYFQFLSGKGVVMEGLKKDLESAKGNAAATEDIKQRMKSVDDEVKNYQKKVINENPGMLLSKILLAGQDPEIPEAPLKPDGSKDSTFAYRYYRAHFFDKIDLKDDRMLKTPVFASKLKQYIEKLIPQIPDSICVAAKDLIDRTAPQSDIFKYLVYYVTNTYEKSNVMGMDAVFVCMAESYYLSGKAFWIDSTQEAKIRERVEALKPCLIGAQAYNMRMLKTDFHPIALNDLKNTYTIVYFWGHCQKVTPKLSEFYNKNKTRFDLEVFGVYIETDTTEWFKYIREKELKWLNVADLTLKSNFRKYYDIYSTPVIYVLDRNKKIIAKRLDVENLEDFLKNYEKRKTN
jgi:hypothetical protein